MNGIDASTWSAMGVTLSVVGLALSVLLWRARGSASGLRAVAWSLLPAAAGLTGTLRLVWQVGDLVAHWATRLVFSPVVWLGIALAGLSVVLFGVSGVLRARGAGGAPAKDATGRRAIPSERSSAPAAPRGAKAAPADPELDDIEAILRKHGIS